LSFRSVRFDQHDNNLSHRCCIVNLMTRSADIDHQLSLLVADVFEAAGAMRRQGDEIAAAAGQTQARWQVLSVLSDGDWTVPRIARRLGVTRQAVQRTVDALAADHLVVSTANPDHKRSVLVRLTDTGRAALAAITTEADARLAQAPPAISARDLQVARSVLRALITSSR
jgi:DNA-binding MarR family transcriptional regulator